MRVLIIGGTGLISSAVTLTLARQGHNITLYNRGRREAPLPSGVSVLTGDRTNYTQFEAQLSTAGPFDVVVDMICFSAADAECAVHTFRSRTGQYILCSTVDVYQRPAVRYPYLENHPRQPRSAYAAGKIEAEDVFTEAQAAKAFALTIVRPGFTTGEGGIIVHTFARSTSYLDRIRKGKPVVVHGDGNGFWTAAHRDDVGPAIAAAVGNSSALGRTYQVTGEEWLTWNRYLEIVAQAMDAPAPTFVHIPTDVLAQVAPKHAYRTIEHYQFHGIFDNAAARADLGYRYTIPWLETARRTTQWLDAHGRIENSDLDDFDDRLIAAWERLGESLAQETAPLER